MKLRIFSLVLVLFAVSSCSLFGNEPAPAENTPVPTPGPCEMHATMKIYYLGLGEDLVFSAESSATVEWDDWSFVGPDVEQNPIWNHDDIARDLLFDNGLEDYVELVRHNISDSNLRMKECREYTFEYFLSVGGKPDLASINPQNFEIHSEEIELIISREVIVDMLQGNEPAQVLPPVIPMSRDDFTVLISDNRQKIVARYEVGFTEVDDVLSLLNLVALSYKDVEYYSFINDDEIWGAIVVPE